MINIESFDKDNKIEELTNLFYKQININPPYNSLPECVKIINKIKRIDKDLDIFDLENELRNVYVFLLNSLYKSLFVTKYRKKTGYSPEQINKIVGLGFITITRVYDSETKEFVAQSMTTDIINNTFPNYEFDIEYDIHNKFNSLDSVKQNGIKKTIIDIINTYDSNLGSYLMCNSKVLNNNLTKVNKILDNYDEYEKQSNKNRYNYIVEEFRDYCEKIDLDPEEYLFRLLAEHNVLTELTNNSDYYSYSDYARIKEIAISSSRNEIDFNYMYLRKRLEKYLNTKIIINKIEDINKKDFINAIEEYFKIKENINDKEQMAFLATVLEKVDTNNELDELMGHIDFLNNKKTNSLLYLYKKKSNSDQK